MIINNSVSGLGGTNNNKMNTRFILLCFIWILFAGIACQNQKQTDENAEEQTKEQIMNGRKTQLLYGNVSKVTYTDGNFAEFNKDGNIVRKKENYNNTIWEYDYVNNKRYILQNEPYNIIYNDSMRIEMWDSREQLSIDYTFDSKGRLIEVSEVNYGWYTNTKYHYKDDEILPYKEIMIGGDETGETISTSFYTYIEIDHKGNWLSCNIETISESEDNEAGDNQKTTEKRYRSPSREIKYFSEKELRTPQEYNAEDKKSSM